MKSFMTRLISGLILVLLAAGTCWYGGLPLGFFVAAAGYIGLDEFYKVFGLSITGGIGRVGYLGAGIWTAVMLVTVQTGMENGAEFKWMALIVAFLLLMAVYVFTFPAYESGQVMTAFFGIVYIPVMLSFVYLTRMLEAGEYLVWLIFFSSWGCDTFAYCTGMLIGKHKLAPVLSPKKSVEGAVGGIVGAAALGAVFAACIGAPVWIYASICAVGAAASQVGDLAASAVKRQHGIKDYGKIIPGHGGILDRFDSVIVTAPMIYLLAAVLMYR